MAEPLAGDLADAPGTRSHPCCDLSSIHGWRRRRHGPRRIARNGWRSSAARSPTVPASTCSATRRAASSTSARRSRSAAASPAHFSEQPPRDGQRDRPHRVRARLQRGRGAARRAELHQAVPAALQRPAARRQVLSVHRDLDGRGVPARLLHARAPSPRPSVLRPVLQRQARPRHARPAREDLPVPLVHRRRAGPAQRLAVPGLLHQALRGALRRLRLAGGVPRLDRGASSRSCRAATARSSATSSSA